MKFCRSCGAELARPATSSGEGYPARQPLPGVYAGAASAGLAPVVTAPGGVAAGLVQPAVFPYGGFWIRLVAYVLDVVILLVATVILGAMAGILSIVSDRSGGLASTFGSLAGLVVNVVYFVVFPPALGATPGKLALGYHIVDEDGRHVGYGRAIARYLAQALSALVLLLGYVWIGVDAHKQGWHDKIAGTYVVRKEFVKH